MKLSVEEVYTSASCNRTPEIVDWNEDGLICFGACNAVVLYNTKIKAKNQLKVIGHHSSRVNSVKWLRKPDGSSTELVSCSADKTAVIWSLIDGEWKKSVLSGHTEGVTCVHGVYTQGNDLEIYTGAIDSTVKVWERKADTVSLKHSIDLHSGLCLTLHAHIVPAVSKPVLFCALDDHKIHVYAGEEYRKVHTLVGHEDWVRGLDVLDVDNSSFLLASGSQDTYIRLWRFQQYVPQPQSGINVEEKVFLMHDKQWTEKIDAVLAGHEGWVYGVQFQPSCNEGGANTGPIYRLLSSSLDKTLIIWGPEEGTRGRGVWMEHVRVGEVGGNGLGFYGSRFGPSGISFMGHGYNGSFHIWTYNKEINNWEPSTVCGGHFNSVEDVRWEPRQGRYIMSTSADQTTRVHAPIQGTSEWHEVSRAQVHGYDLAALALVSPTVFASAAEEKVIRVFTAPKNFITNFKNIVGEDIGSDSNVAPDGASVPSLGLSNKAVFTGDAAEPDAADDNDKYYVPVVLNSPPTEETLMQNTLWPETQKLYGHGYEVFALCASREAGLLASACRATTAEHAAILIWDTSTWQQIQKLVYHQLTVTQLSFSADGGRLLAVSRDRRLSVWQRRAERLQLAAATDRTNAVHTRIIWCCAWADDGQVFATGSRDGKVCIWSKTEVMTETSLKDYALQGKPLERAQASVTAVAFAPVKFDDARVVAVGYETGHIQLFSFDGCGWSSLIELDNNSSHHLTVRRLAFKPTANTTGALLASCGADHFVRIHAIHLN